MIPEQPKPEVSLGRIAGVFGIRGELKLQPTRAGTDALAPGLDVIVEAAGARLPAKLRAVRAHQTRYLIRFEGIDTPEAAATYVGGTLLADRSRVPMHEGEYLDADLVGLQLVDAGGTALGNVREVLHYPAQDLLVVGTQRALVPLVSAFVKDVDVRGGRIVVDLPPGLLDAADAEEA